MKKEKLEYKDLLDKSKKEIIALLHEKKLALFSLKMQSVSGQLKDFSQISYMRKDIARINTALRNKK